MSQHKHFEIMCAVAAVGQLSPSDLAELRRHVKDCADCRGRLSEFAQVSAQALLEFGEKRRHNHRLPAGMTARFVARARAEGIPLHKSAHSLPRELFPPGWKGNIAAVLLLLAVVAGMSNHRHTPAFSTRSFVAGSKATGEAPFETESLRVRTASPLFKPKRAVPTEKSHRRFANTGGAVPGVHSSEPGLTAPLELIPARIRYSANCDQVGVKQESSFPSRASEIQEPRLFPAAHVSQQSGPVTLWFLFAQNSPPPIFPYATDRPSVFEVPSSQRGMLQPPVDWSKIHLRVLPPPARTVRLPQYQEIPEQGWPFSNEFKVDAR
jgi:hypothetical protein